jgi:lipopolysaccharide O-acetyltransferase
MKQIRNKYNFFQKIQLIYFVIRTKIICRKVRLIRFPIELRGKKYIDFGSNLTTGVGCRLDAFSETKEKTVRFGMNVQINDYVHICAMQQVSIGNNVLMASHIYISDNSHGSYKGNTEDTSPDIAPINRSYYKSPVMIEDNVWIGEGVVVLPGVRIGKSAIIGANAVVTKNIPDYCIAIGNPAKIIKKYNSETKHWEKITIL